jgi:hypothetical protein
MKHKISSVGSQFNITGVTLIIASLVLLFSISAQL